MAWRENEDRRVLSSEVRSVFQYRASVATSRKRHQPDLLDGSTRTRLVIDTAKGPVVGYVGLSTLS